MNLQHRARQKLLGRWKIVSLKSIYSTYRQPQSLLIALVSMTRSPTLRQYISPAKCADIHSVSCGIHEYVRWGFPSESACGLVSQCIYVFSLQSDVYIDT